MAGVQMVLSVAEIFVTVGLCFLISSNQKKIKDVLSNNSSKPQNIEVLRRKA